MQANLDESTAQSPTTPQEIPLLRDPRAALALALLVIELLAGMQVYLSATVVPLMAADLHGQHLYGVTIAAALVASFLTMPLGGALLSRMAAHRLLTILTFILVLGALVSAFAPTMAAYIVGRIIAGLASGAMATVSMGVTVNALPPRWRQLLLGFNNMVWLISSVVGPAYAAWLSHLLNWRWAMVAYLPLLFAARLVVAQQLKRLPPPKPGAKKLPWREAVLLAGGVACLATLGLDFPLRWVIAAVGLGLIGLALTHLLPPSVKRLELGQSSAILTLGLLAAIFFGSDAMVAILAHDQLHFSTVELGFLLTAGGFAWSAVGLYAARFPVEGKRLVKRTQLGSVGLFVGLLLMALSLMHVLPVVAFTGGWLVMGTGMGLCFLDLMNAAFTDDAVNPLVATDASTAVVLIESVSSAVAATLCTSILAFAPQQGAAILLGLAVLVPLFALLITRKVVVEL